MDKVSAPTKGGLWDAVCAGRAAMAAVVGVSTAGILGLVAHHWSTVMSALGWLVGAGGFWHSLSVVAVLALASVYFACVSWKREPDSPAGEAAHSLAVFLALVVGVSLLCVAVTWADDAGPWHWRISAIAVVFVIAFAACASALGRAAECAEGPQP